MKYQKQLIVIIALFIASCSKPEQEVKDSKKIKDRWYTEQQVKQGHNIFQAHCATCHKSDASGAPNWKQVDAKGKYPAPPLNGNAHAWHHSLDALKRTIWFGGIRLGGTMPWFKDKLTEAQVEATLAWIQTHWNDTIYNEWKKRNNTAIN